MKKIGKFLKTIIKIGLVIYGLLFVVFYFDLDGKALFYGVEPFLANHYDKMKRRDPLTQAYSMDKPNYEYKV